MTGDGVGGTQERTGFCRFFTPLHQDVEDPAPEPDRQAGVGHGNFVCGSLAGGIMESAPLRWWAGRYHTRALAEQAECSTRSSSAQNLGLRHRSRKDPGWSCVTHFDLVIAVEKGMPRRPGPLGARSKSSPRPSGDVTTFRLPSVSSRLFGRSAAGFFDIGHRSGLLAAAFRHKRPDASSRAMGRGLAQRVSHIHRFAEIFPENGCWW